MKTFMKSLKEYINEGLLDRVKNKEVNHEILVEEFLKENYNIKGSYTIKYTNKGFVGFVVDVKGSVEIKNENISSLTNEFFEFGEVSGIFYCSNCHLLKTLKGAPKEVVGYFYCDHCDSLKSLKGAPKEVGGSFNCSHCRSLKTLEGAPQKVDGSFYCHQCNSLKTLEGAPQKVSGHFCCYYCYKLKTLEGAPKEVGGNFDCGYCDLLSSLEGAPKKVGGGFYCNGCGIEFTESDVKKHTTVAKKIYV